ncbi:ACP S-malonyltransferase [Kutzneria sp. NPDC052558]|uniref:ACP S-malonyltransferase n=1 Tax=Kutzneria sp. NPDC052558 TaxID=3364121 RepID=UPI0037C92EF8
MESAFRAGTAMVFPGMGPTTFAEASGFMLNDPTAIELTAIADGVLGYSLVDRFRAAEHDYTEAAQVAFMLNCVALAHWARRELGTTPDVVAGPSFGGKAAVAFAGCLPFAQAVRLTAELARCTEDYFRTAHADIVTYSFARTPEPALRAVLAELAERGSWHEVAGRVDHDFHMISLPDKETDWLSGRVRAAGGLPLYTMRPPMHAAAFAELRDRAEREVLSGLRFSDPVLPLVDDHDGTLVTDAAGVRRMLLDGITRALSWPSVVGTLKRAGVEDMVVCGQDRLFGRVPLSRNSFRLLAVTPRLAAGGAALKR